MLKQIRNEMGFNLNDGRWPVQALLLTAALDIPNTQLMGKYEFGGKYYTLPEYLEHLQGLGYYCGNLAPNNLQVFMLPRQSGTTALSVTLAKYLYDNSDTFGGHVSPNYHMSRYAFENYKNLLKIEDFQTEGRLTLYPDAVYVFDSATQNMVLKLKEQNIVAKVFMSPTNDNCNFVRSLGVNYLILDANYYPIRQKDKFAGYPGDKRNYFFLD